MMAEQFIDRLERQGLLDKKIVAELRRKVGKVSKKKKVTAEAIAKLLVDAGHLTKFQATKLIGEVTEKAAVEKQQKAAPAQTREMNSDDELGFAPSDSRIDVAVEDNETRDLGGGQDLVEVEDLEELEPAPAKPAAKAAPAPAAQPQRPPESPPEAPPTAPPPAPASQPAAGGLGELLEENAEDDIEAMEGGSPLMPTQSKGGIFGLFGGGGQAASRHAGERLQPVNQWDSKLLLIGSGTLGVLLIIGGFLFYSLTRGSADEMFQAAEDDYRNGSYTQAIKRFDQFLDNYPRNPKASKARVLRGVCQLRQAYTNAEQGLKVAREVLPGIEKEEAFPDARTELASMLPQIAQSFVADAIAAKETKVKEDLLLLTSQAMELVNNPTYIPTTLRRSQEAVISQIEEDQSRVQRDISREKELVSSIADINLAVGAGDTLQAYAIRESLISKYPGLELDESLREAVLKISEKQRELVQTSSESVDAVAADHERSSNAKVVLSNKTGNAVPGLQDQVVFVLAGGSVFGLNASTGDVLWSRFVGFETTFHPVPISTRQVGADAVAIDARHNELIRLEAQTGRLVWRLPLPAKFADPLITDENGIFVSTTEGIVYAVDPETGKSSRHVKIPESLTVAAGTDDRRPRLYQCGDHDNLYILSRDSLACDDVYYIGHRAGTIDVPPVMAVGYLFVAENAGSDFCNLHVLETDADGLNPKRAQNSLRLRGNVVVPMVASRRRVLVVTDLGEIRAFDVDPNNTASPVTPAVNPLPPQQQPMVSYPLYDRGYLWLANQRFTKYQVQTSKGELVREWVKDEGDVYVSPMQIYGDVIFHVRRRQKTPGLTVSALRVNEEQPMWQTDLAVPLTKLHVAEDSTLHVINSRGQLFDVGDEHWEQGRLNTAAEAAQQMPPGYAMTESLDLEDGTTVLSPSGDYDQVFLYEPGETDGRLRMLQLQVTLQAATTPPVAFAGGLLIPTKDGQISLIDPKSGGPRVLPYHPAIAPGSETDWLTPDALPGDADRFVIADNHQMLFQVGIKDDPQPHLAELKAIEVTGRLAAALAAVGDTVYGVVRGGGGDAVVAYGHEDLKAGQEWQLDGRILWGPQRIADVVLVASDKQLMCFEAGQQQRWAIELDQGGLAGAPISDGEHLIFATQSGRVVRIAADSGQEIAAVNVGEPLGSPPYVRGDQLIVAGLDGSVVMVPKP